MKKYILLGSFALILIAFLSNCTKNSSVATGDSSNPAIVVEEDEVNIPDEPNGGGTKLRRFECSEPTDCFDPGSGPCPCATCYETTGNCLATVVVHNYMTGGSNVSDLDNAIATGRVQDFWNSNSDLWVEFFPEAPSIVLEDLQDGLITMQMYSVSGDREHIYVVVLLDGSPANY